MPGAAPLAARAELLASAGGQDERVLVLALLLMFVVLNVAAEVAVVVIVVAVTVFVASSSSSNISIHNLLNDSGFFASTHKLTNLLLFLYHNYTTIISTITTI